MSILTAWLCKFRPHAWRRSKTVKVCKRCGLERQVKQRKPKPLKVAA
jgi:hypothetical protein